MIPSASFYLCLLDKNGKRVGEGYLEVTNLAPGQRARIRVSVHAMGGYASMEFQPQHLPSDEPLKIKMRITSVPSGASFKLDSQDAGTTPQMLPSHRASMYWSSAKRDTPVPALLGTSLGTKRLAPLKSN